MATRIIVLSDGTWELAGSAQVLTVTDDAYRTLADGQIDASELRAEDVIDERVIE